MSAELSLPGAIPDLLRECSPLVAVRDIDDVPRGARGVVVRVHPDILIAAFRWSDDPDDIGAEVMQEFKREDVELDLGHPTGRHHAGCYLAARGVPDGQTIGMWRGLVDGALAGGGKPERIRDAVLLIAEREAARAA